MTTVAAGICAKKRRKTFRESLRLSATLPGSWDTAASKTAFAISTATTLSFFSMGSSSLLLQGRLWHMMPTES
jgi:hypothetical protein